MIIYDGKKYACISCIRGHRSSQCDHRSRPLIQVRKRGRPLPDAKPLKQTTEPSGNIVTDLYVFEPVGDDLYKKHLRSEYLAHQARAESPSPFDSFATNPELIAPMELNHADLTNELGVTQAEVDSMWPEGDTPYIPSCVIPNQCRCGDSCACPDCYTHGTRA